MKFWVGSNSVTVNVPDWRSLESAISDRYSAGKGFVLATLNMDHLAKLQNDKGMQFAYGGQDLVVADGNPIVWMSELANHPVSLMPGSDMVEPLAQYCADNNLSIALVGSTPESLRGAARSLEQSVPGIDIVRRVSPAFGFDPKGEDAQAILQDIADSGAKLCFVALGAPKQEVFATFGREIAPGVGFACVGAGLDFLAGSQTRAPVWVRKMSMEWLWRLGTNPQRLGARYLRCIGILPGHLMRSAVRDQTR